MIPAECPAHRPILPAPLVKLPVIAKSVRTLAVGSELRAAGGRGSEVSEWPRSKFPASAVRQRGNFGHRNRNIRLPRPHGPLPKGGAFFRRGGRPCPPARGFPLRTDRERVRCRPRNTCKKGRGNPPPLRIVLFTLSRKSGPLRRPGRERCSRSHSGGHPERRSRSPHPGAGHR